MFLHYRPAKNEIAALRRQAELNKSLVNVTKDTVTEDKIKTSEDRTKTTESNKTNEERKTPPEGSLLSRLSEEKVEESKVNNTTLSEKNTVKPAP